MSRHKSTSDQYTDTSGFNVKSGLENLMRRLHPGMEVQGRIVEVIGGDRYLLRIWGYNILTESHKQFSKFEEVDLTVLQVNPHLVLDIKKKNTGKTGLRDGMNVLV